MSKFFPKGFFIGFLVTFVLGMFLLSGYLGPVASENERILSVAVLPFALIAAFLGGLTGIILARLQRENKRTQGKGALIGGALFFFISYFTSFLFLPEGSLGRLEVVRFGFGGFIAFLLQLIFPILIMEYLWPMVLLFVVVISGFFWTYFGLGVGYLVTRRKK